MNGMDVDQPILRLRDIRKTLPSGRRLLEIDELSIHAGRCLLLTGANGIGKTTLLKILSGLEPPDHALVDCDGTHLLWSVARRRFRREVIYLHQEAYLFDRSVTDNVTYGLRGLGLSRAQVAERVQRSLEWAGLSHLAARNARELSGGEQQRVALTRALVLTPQVLLLDEPFSGLDEESRSRTGFLIQRLKSERVGVVVTSHELLPMSGIADEHLELHAGRLVPPTRSVQRASTGHRPREVMAPGEVAYFDTKGGR
ncbi:MAG: energy-coupling factor ABC transporter ATP-binding protein [Gammaproteobacteria bacterium]|nr:energy-coupling factor ABC transporter ATP-binding protein [Gammaproteobacteria bacterium]